MTKIRTKNMFGRRFISPKNLSDYVVDLDLDPHAPTESFLEFLEREGLLTPVRRLCFPTEVVRRIRDDPRRSQQVVEPVEPDGERLDAAVSLLDRVDRWSNARVFGETEHPLDTLDQTHRPFIRNDFPTTAFTPWKDRRVKLYETDRGPVYASHMQASPSFYHYWQIFSLAAILRSGVHVWFPLDEGEIFTRILREGVVSRDGLGGRVQQSVNLEAYHELKSLRKHAVHFEAVGYFVAYTHNALQTFQSYRDDLGRIPARPWKKYLAREHAIAQDALRLEGLHEDDLISFIGEQCKWWDNARRVGPAALADEYKRNIRATIMCLKAATGLNAEDIVQRVGRKTGHFKPTLKVIFPDWVEEQRDLTLRSLKQWIDEDFAALPSPFPYSASDLNEFCDWLEERGLYQFYWHFKRIVDLQRSNDPVDHAASSAEVVSFATLCEMISNEVLRDRRSQPRGDTLSRKLKKIFNSNGPVDLCMFFDRYYKLTSTNKQSLSQRLAQIARIKAGGPYNLAVRTLLSIWDIRYEGAHLGLLNLDQVKIIEMIRILSLASLLLWKAR